MPVKTVRDDLVAMVEAYEAADKKQGHLITSLTPMSAAVNALLARHPEWHDKPPTQGPMTGEEFDELLAAFAQKRHNEYWGNYLRQAVDRLLVTRAAPIGKPMHQAPNLAEMNAMRSAFTSCEPSDTELIRAAMAVLCERLLEPAKEAGIELTDRECWAAHNIYHQASSLDHPERFRRVGMFFLSRRAEPVREPIMVTQEMVEECLAAALGKSQRYTVIHALNWLVARLTKAPPPPPQPPDPRVELVRKWAEQELEMNIDTRLVPKLLARMDEMQKVEP